MRWYNGASKRRGRAGGGISNGDFCAAFRVHRPQQFYHAETMTCTIASHLAQPREEIILDNQGVVKPTPVPQKGDTLLHGRIMPIPAKSWSCQGHAGPPEG